MLNQFSRTALLLGKDNMQKIHNSKVAIFGIGGVGGHAAEALARTGVELLDLFDNDKVSITNLNRQIIALHSTIGKYKVDVMKERILDINPNAAVNANKLFYLPETADQIDLSQYDYIIDAVDTITAKIELVLQALKSNVPIISSMGAANKIDASAFEVSDIFKTSVCPVARVMRHELKKRNINKLKVVYSKETPLKPAQEMLLDFEEQTTKRQIPASNAFVPATAGLIIAGEVIKDLFF